jgi:hypothetical protein
MLGMAAAPWNVSGSWSVKAIGRAPVSAPASLAMKPEP